MSEESENKQEAQEEQEPSVSGLFSGKPIDTLFGNEMEDEDDNPFAPPKENSAPFFNELPGEFSQNSLSSLVDSETEDQPPFIGALHTEASQQALRQTYLDLKEQEQQEKPNSMLTQRKNSQDSIGQGSTDDLNEESFVQGNDQFNNSQNHEHNGDNNDYYNDSYDDNPFGDAQDNQEASFLFGQPDDGNELTPSFFDKEIDRTPEQTFQNKTKPNEVATFFDDNREMNKNSQMDSSFDTVQNTNSDFCTPGKSCNQVEDNGSANLFPPPKINKNDLIEDSAENFQETSNLFDNQTNEDEDASNIFGDFPQESETANLFGQEPTETDIGSIFGSTQEYNEAPSNEPNIYTNNANPNQRATFFDQQDQYTSPPKSAQNVEANNLFGNQPIEPETASLFGAPPEEDISTLFGSSQTEEPFEFSAEQQNSYNEQQPVQYEQSIFQPQQQMQSSPFVPGINATPTIPGLVQRPVTNASYYGANHQNAPYTPGTNTQLQQPQAMPSNNIYIPGMREPAQTNQLVQNKPYIPGFGTSSPQQPPSSVYNPVYSTPAPVAPPPQSAQSNFSNPTSTFQPSNQSTYKPPAPSYIPGIGISTPKTQVIGTFVPQETPSSTPPQPQTGYIHPNPVAPPPAIKPYVPNTSQSNAPYPGATQPPTTNSYIPGYQPTPQTSQPAQYIPGMNASNATQPPPSQYIPQTTQSFKPAPPPTVYKPPPKIETPTQETPKPSYIPGVSMMKEQHQTQPQIFRPPETTTTPNMPPMTRSSQMYAPPPPAPVAQVIPTTNAPIPMPKFQPAQPPPEAPPKPEIGVFNPQRQTSYPQNKPSHVSINSSPVNIQQQQQQFNRPPPNPVFAAPPKMQYVPPPVISNHLPETKPTPQPTDGPKFNSLSSSQENLNPQPFVNHMITRSQTTDKMSQRVVGKLPSQDEFQLPNSQFRSISQPVNIGPSSVPYFKHRKPLFAFGLGLVCQMKNNQIEVKSLHEICPNEPTVVQLKTFTASSTDVDAFINQRIHICESASNILLWAAVRVRYQHNFTIDISKFNINTKIKGTPEQMLITQLSQGIHQNIGNIPDYQDSSADSSLVEGLQKVIVDRGEREALEYAIEKKLWPFALIIANSLSRDDFKRVTSIFIQNSMSQSSLTNILKSITGISNNLNETNWQESLNTTLRHYTTQSVPTLISIAQFLEENGDIQNSHVCRLMAGQSIEPFPSTFSLVGAPWDRPTITSVQMSQLSNKHSLSFYPYAIFYTMALIDYGFLNVANTNNSKILERFLKEKAAKSLCQICEEISRKISAVYSKKDNGVMQSLLFTVDKVVKNMFGEDEANQDDKIAQTDLPDIVSFDDEPFDSFEQFEDDEFGQMDIDNNPLTTSPIIPRNEVPPPNVKKPTTPVKSSPPPSKPQETTPKPKPKAPPPEPEPMDKNDEKKEESSGWFGGLIRKIIPVKKSLVVDLNSHDGEELVWSDKLKKYVEKGHENDEPEEVAPPPPPKMSAKPATLPAAAPGGSNPPPGTATATPLRTGSRARAAGRYVNQF